LDPFAPDRILEIGKAGDVLAGTCQTGRKAAADRIADERTAKKREELAAPHVWMAPAWQEIIWRAAQRSLAVMCPACWCSPGGLLALMGCANRVLIIQTGSMSR